MLHVRVIPCLLVHDGALVKTVRFASPRYVGDPINAVRIFNEKEVDELMVLDIDATVERRPPDLQLIGDLAAECRMPLCYGGGVSTVEQARQIIGLGVEKVAIGAAAALTPELVTEIADSLGAQSVVGVIDVRRGARGGGAWEVWVYNGRQKTPWDAVQLATELERRGAGEIVVNSIDQDGTMAGYDLELGRAVCEATRVPVTLLGGAGSVDDLHRAVAALGRVGLAAGSLFVFKGVHRAVLINYPGQHDRDRVTAALAAESGPRAI
jgi:cyclase